MKEDVFFQWVMTITINMVNDFYRRKKNAPNMVTLDNEAVLAYSGEYSLRKARILWKFEHMYIEIHEVFQLLSLFERELIQDLFSGFKL